MARGHVLSAVLISLLPCSPLAAQSTSYTPKLTFDVATVREAAIGDSFTVRSEDELHSSYMMLQNYDIETC